MANVVNLSDLSDTEVFKTNDFSPKFTEELSYRLVKSWLETWRKLETITIENVNKFENRCCYCCKNYIKVLGLFRLCPSPQLSGGMIFAPPRPTCHICT